MTREQWIIDTINGFVWVLIALVLVLMLRLARARKVPEQPVLLDNPDFEEFYLDLCSSTLTVDFTRAEAEGLYRVWLRCEKVAN